MRGKKRNEKDGERKKTNKKEGTCREGTKRGQGRLKEKRTKKEELE